MLDVGPAAAVLKLCGPAARGHLTSTREPHMAGLQMQSGGVWSVLQPCADSSLLLGQLRKGPVAQRHNRCVAFL